MSTATTLGHSALSMQPGTDSTTAKLPGKALMQLLSEINK